MKENGIMEISMETGTTKIKILTSSILGNSKMAISLEKAELYTAMEASMEGNSGTTIPME